MRTIVTILWMLVVTMGIQAQTISGKLVDEKNEPLAYANIVLQQTDSTFVTGTTSDEKGGFRLSKVSEGHYRLVISILGYQTMYIDLEGFARSTNLGVFTLKDASQQLGEVTVTANGMVGTVDKKLVFPTTQQIKASANGVDLLGNLMLPRLSINPISNEIGTTDGGSVQFAINGRKASQQEVTALQPSDILRVELLEDPGLRYSDVAVVVNYVVKHHDTGGSFGYNGEQSTKSGWGKHNANGKLNFGKSEMSFYYSNRLTYFNEYWFDREEAFRFEDGKEYHRSQHTETDGEKRFTESAGLTYNLQDDNRYMLNVSAQLDHNLDPNKRFYGELYTKEYPDLVTYRHQSEHRRRLRPSLDIYYQRNLKHKQFIAFNAVGTYIDTKNRSTYAEYLNDEAVVDYTSGVEGKKYSLIVEGIYEKRFANNGRLTAGFTHTQGYTDNVYGGTLDYHTKMKSATTYGYAQYRGKWKKLSYNLGLGFTRSWFHQEQEESYDSWTFNPRFSLSYKMNKHWSASLQGRISTTNPSLAELSAVDQLIDSLQIERGNPNLKPGYNYSVNVRLNYSKGKWNVGLYGNYTLWDNVIISHIYPENNKFVLGYANHPSAQRLNSGVEVRVGPFWKKLILAGGIHASQNWSHGVDYKHTHHSIGWQLGVNFMHKNFSAMFMYENQPDFFFGEYMSRSDKAHLIDLRYKLKNLNIGMRMYNPFQSDYADVQKNVNRYVSYREEMHTDDVARMITVSLSWNFSFGRDYQSKSKRTSNSDTDSGVM